MALRKLFGCLLAAALAVCAWTACKDKADVNVKKDSPADLDRRCEQLGMVCADTEKHVDKLVQECTQAAKQHQESGCADKASAVYDCYERELCGKADKVWALDDFRVLVERHGKCVTERDALRACVDK